MRVISGYFGLLGLLRLFRVMGLVLGARFHYPTAVTKSNGVILRHSNIINMKSNLHHIPL